MKHHKWVDKNYSELVKLYNKEWIAIKSGVVIAHGKTLNLRLKGVFVYYIGTPDKISPRCEVSSSGVKCLPFDSLCHWPHSLSEELTSSEDYESPLNVESG